MTLAEAPPAAVPAPPPRRRRRVWTVALVVLVLVATAAASYVLTYDPLRHGSGVLAFGRDRPGSLPLPDATVTNALGTEFQVRQPAVGTRLGVAFGLTNDGPFDVEVVRVGSPFPDHLFSSGEPIGSAAPGGSGEPYPALEPFVLEAGRSRDVGVLARADGCPDAPTEASLGGLVVGQVPVTWRFAGITRTSHVDLAFRGSVAGYPQCASP